MQRTYKSRSGTSEGTSDADPDGVDVVTEVERKMLKDIHDALLSVPPGSPSDARPLLEDIRTVVRAYQRASWATRAIVWLLPAIAGIGVAFTTIKGWIVQ